MNVALLDGAVQGMASRLLQVGYLPDEAFCIAQAAYLKPQKFAPGTPQPVLTRRQDISWEVSQTLALLRSFPMGDEAHRQRILLWEKIFGRGSWHEPIDPSEIYLSPIEEYEVASRAHRAASAALPPVPAMAPVPTYQPVTKEYDFYLPGEVGVYSDSYGHRLVESCKAWLVEHALGEGFMVGRQSVHAELLNVDFIRGAGHNLEPTGLQWHMGLAVHVVATGTQSQ